jgi:phosphoglycerate dehydrogenase-like enzyme
MRSLVLVTEPEFRRAEAVFRSAPDFDCVAAPDDERELAAAVVRTGARYVIAGPRRYQSALYDAMPRGGVIARFGVGIDGLDLPKATAAGILCTNTPGVLDQSVAELTMLLIAAAARHLVSMAAGMAGERWTPSQGLELQGRTLAIVGCGRIGRAVARIATRGFGMRVIGCRRASSRVDAAAEDFAAVVDDFAAAVHDADFVSLHIPAAPENVRYVNADRLARLRPQAWLINTARGAVIDEAALYDAVAGSRLAGAALDVFEREPYQPADPARDLRTLANVVLTPHVGSHTVEANRRMAERALANLALAKSGQFAGMDLLNPDVTV